MRPENIDPSAQYELAEADLELGLRVMTPDRQLLASVHGFDRKGFSILWDGTRCPSEYEWRDLSILRVWVN